MSQHTTIQQIFMATEQSDPVVVLHAVGDVRGSQFEMLLQKSGLDADKVLEIVHEGVFTMLIQSVWMYALRH